MKNLFFVLTLFVLTSALLTTGCTPIVATRGNMLSDAKFDKVQPQLSTRADVVQAWGPPTTTASFDPNTWYYIGETTEQRGIFAPEVVKRRIILVKFNHNDNDTVEEITDVDPTQGKQLKFVDRKTPTAGKELTAIQQLIGNMGKYNRGQMGGNK